MKNFTLSAAFALLVCLAPAGVCAQHGPEADQQYHRDYWPSGNVRSQEPLVKGIKHGLAEYYHDNGKLYAKIPWKDGQKHGPFTLYRDTGVIEQELHYTNGRMDGLIKWYYPDGTLSTAIHYKDGKMHGNGKWYDTKGVLTDEAQYVNGQVEKVLMSSPPSQRSWWKDSQWVETLVVAVYVGFFFVLSLVSGRLKKKRGPKPGAKRKPGEFFKRAQKEEVKLPEIKNPYTILLVIRRAMIAGGLVMGAAAYYVTEHCLGGPLLDQEQVQVLQYVLLGAVVIIFTVISRVNGYAQKLISDGSTGLESENRAGDNYKIAALTIALFALSESFFIAGLVASILTDNLIYFLVLAIMGFFAFRAVTPEKNIFMNQHELPNSGV